MEESHAFTASHRVTPLIAGSQLYADNLTKEKRIEGERGKERETRGNLVNICKKVGLLSPSQHENFNLMDGASPGK